MAKATLLIAAVALCVAITQIDAVKRCPALKPGEVGTCHMECDFSQGPSFWVRRRCPTGKLCCSNGCGRVCVDGVEDSGICPSSSGFVGACVFQPGFNCLSDDECASQGKLCCSEGCGRRVCKNPVSPPPPPPTGVCPPSRGGVSGCVFGSNNCLSDEECGQGRLCCSEGCGRVCKNPVVTGE